ncbi:MAG: polysaccharide deacetylase family protein [Anaerolineales bacterium]|uniref:polysaccharide deacetylase family protein n=1 Tax=Candidatus Villigracilis proximus TaxID=3140683 RepID=UPI003136BD45|nr:polysaccharide deacetylase family protein [Anaerolineales bacterium]
MKTNYGLKASHLFLTLSLLAGLLAACQPAAATADPNIVMTAAYETAVAQISIPTETPAPTDTPVPTATIPRTPPALPATYQTSLLKPEDLPRTYVTDSCQYLQNKWNSNNALPGTIIMPVMFHGITKDAATGLNQISAQDFKKLMNDLHELGFQAINMQQMVDFMYNNTNIPPRSVLLIVDDRHFAESFNDHFRTYYEQWGWPVVNAYIGIDERPDLWAENAALSAEGWVDYQAHGYIHNIPIMNSSTDEFINGEMGGAITSLQKYMNKTPVGYIWPGGGFSARAVEIGTQLGYKLGFTVNQRGPVMYNWIPQADAVNQSNPMAIPEVPANNPLMTIPRYWDVNARGQLDTVIQIGEQAALMPNKIRPSNWSITILFARRH